MSDRYRGTIEFPASALEIEEIRKEVIKEGVYFDHDGPQAQFDNEVQINDGVFFLTVGAARYGQFELMETALKENGIPFDRDSEAFYDMTPERVIYRPEKDGSPEQELTFQLMDDEPVVSVAALREIMYPSSLSPGEILTGGYALAALESYLNEHFPAYPPLTDWVKEG